MWILSPFVLPSAAQGFTQDKVTNTRTNVEYDTVTLAIGAAAAGDRLWVDGLYSENVHVDKDLFLDGAPGAEISWSGAGAAVIELDAGFSLTMRGLDLTSSSKRGIQGAQGGNTVILADVVFRTLATGAGGGLQLTDPTALTIADSLFDGTTATTNGGAISVSASALFPMTITDTTFRGASAGSNGGAVYLATTTFSCTRCTFDGTAADNGGAIHDGNGSSVVVQDSTFTGTTALVSGGGIAVGATSTLTVERSGFCGSAAANGGAISGNPITAAVRASTFVEGTAGGAGGAIYATGGAWDVHNDHFLGNGGGAVVEALGGGTTMSLVNDLFVGSVNDAVDGGGASVNLAYSDFYANTNDAVRANLGLGILALEPELRAWTSDGDCTNDDLRPQWTSPLLDAGSNAPVFADPDGGRSDIGAFGGPASDPANHDDDDGDGAVFFADCDDAEAAAAPGEPEVCDRVDNDCDGDVDGGASDIDSWYQDCDRDGQGDVLTRVDQCFRPIGGCPWVSYEGIGELAWLDCDDTEELVFFGATETCDDGDQNCDGDPDMGAVNALPYYRDADQDGYGGELRWSCDANPPGYVGNGEDCNDVPPLGANYHPGAADSCEDPRDTDCNGQNGDDSNIQDWYPDADGDGFGNVDGAIVRDCADRTADSLTDFENATDCDDDLASVYPGAEETCNLVDDDCDLTIDDVSDPEIEWFEDRDLDTYGDRRFPFLGRCQPEAGWIERGLDCDDDDDLVHPGATETCNRVDDDCDDLVDATDPDAQDTVEMWPDADEDGFGACDDGSETCDPEALCPYEVDDTWADNSDDCDDAIDQIHPGAEDLPGDDLDQDCSGSAEPGAETPEEPKGCGCDAGSRGPAHALLLPLLLVALRRRR